MNNKYTKAAILSIGHDTSQAKTLDLCLKELGFKYDFLSVRTLQEGLDITASQHIDLALMDNNLPDAQGLKSVTGFLEAAPHVPLILVVTTYNDIIASQSIKAGAQDYLVMGQFDNKLLARAVRFSLHRFKVLRKLEGISKEFDIFKSRYLEAEKMAHFGTWEMDVVSNEMSWSDEVYRIFSFQKGSFTPTLSEYLKYVPVDDRPLVDAFFEAAGKDSNLHHLEHRIMVGGLNIRYVQVQARVKIEEGGHRVILIGNIQDVTERKLNEKLMLENAISSQSAMVQEEVLSDLGFQIRTPLSSIVNLLYLLGNSATSIQQGNLISDLKTSVNDLSISVNNLLNFSLMVTDTVKVDEEEIILKEFLKGVENVLKIKTDASNLLFHFVPNEGLPEKIKGDPRKITQILYNLAEFTFRNSQEGESIEVCTNCTTSHGGSMGLDVRIVSQQKHYSIAELKELSDAEAKLKLAFSENGKESPAKKRLMGIAIANKLIKSLGGEFSFSNLDKKGAELKIFIPVRPAKQARFSDQEVPVAPLNILLVEDHFLNQLATKKVLQSWSEFVTVDIVENGQLGYEAVRDGNYDLVLMDLQMPVMNGIDSAKKIREFSQVPIIALTANSSLHEQEKCLDVGMNDYLSKPFKPHDLYARILSVLSLVEA